jgi:hypothetical protein
MRIADNNAHFSFTERLLLGWDECLPIEDVPWQGMATELAERKRKLARFTAADTFVAIGYTVDCFFTEAKMKRVTDIAAQICLHQMALSEELAPDIGYPGWLEDDL